MSKKRFTSHNWLAHMPASARIQAIGPLRLTVFCAGLLVCAAASADEAPPATAPVLSTGLPSPAVYDSTLGIKGWNLPFPSFGDTIVQDAGGIRSKLASYGIGFSLFSVNTGYSNLLDNPRTTNGKQVYIGQQPTGFSFNYGFVTLDLSRYGIPNGQIVGEGVVTASSLPEAIPRTASLGSLSYYQTMLDNRIAVKLGYLSNSREFVGSYVGGSLAGGVFGPSASIPYELGMSNSPAPAPGINITANITDHFYDKIGIQRSLSTSANVFVEDKRVNPTGFLFTEPGTSVLYINELGYNRPASPGVPQFWVRAGGLFNSSEYQDYATGGKGTNSGGYLLVDRQIWQSDPSNAQTAFQGLYVGASAMYAEPDKNVYSQYFEARLYGFGLIPGRPFDLTSLVANYTLFSKAARNQVNSLSSQTQTFARSDATSVTLSYSMRIIAGTYLNLALSYTDHPSFTYTRDQGSALNAQANLTLFF